MRGRRRERFDGVPLRPLTPIFATEKKTGAIEVGGTPSTPLVPPPFSGVTPGTLASYGSAISPTGWVKSGDHIYVCGSNTVISIDVSTPMSPSIADTIAVSGPVYLAVDGDYLYVVRRGTVALTNRLYVVDVSDPTNMSVVGTTPANASVVRSNAVYVEGNTAILMNSTSPTCAVVDITNKAAPSHVTQVDSAYARGVKSIRSGDYIFQTSANAFAVVLDVSAPSTPTYSSFTGGLVNGTAIALTEDGNWLFHAANNNVRPIDVSNKAAPSAGTSVASAFMGPLGPIAMTREMILVGDTLCVSERGVSGDGLTYLDASTPASPSIESRRAGSSVGPGDLGVAEDHLFVVNASELEVLDVSDPSSVALVDSFSLSPAVGAGVILGVEHGWVVCNTGCIAFSLDY